MRRDARSRWTALIAAGVAAALCIQLAVAVTAHDPIAHSGGNDHGCVICTFSHASEVGAPVLGEVLSPLSAELPAPDALVTPALDPDDTVETARGPPAHA